MYDTSFVLFDHCKTPKSFTWFTFTASILPFLPYMVSVSCPAHWLLASIQFCITLTGTLYSLMDFFTPFMENFFHSILPCLFHVLPPPNKLWLIANFNQSFINESFYMTFTKIYFLFINTYFHHLSMHVHCLFPPNGRQSQTLGNKFCLNLPPLLSFSAISSWCNTW